MTNLVRNKKSKAWLWIVAIHLFASFFAIVTYAATPTKSTSKNADKKAVSVLAPSLGIKNAFYLDEKQKFIRGKAPNKKAMSQLVESGVTDVLIFKNEVKNEVQEEMDELEELGVPRPNITYIPFKAKKSASYAEACQHTIWALKVLKKIDSSENRKVYLHCSNGTDRTGYLSALFKLLKKDGKIQSLFKSEMCDRGFSAKELTGTYLKIAYHIEKGNISWDDLSTRVCQTDPSNDPRYRSQFKSLKEQYTCSR